MARLRTITLPRLLRRKRAINPPADSVDLLMEAQTGEESADATPDPAEPSVMVAGEAAMPAAEAAPALRETSEARPIPPSPPPISAQQDAVPPGEAVAATGEAVAAADEASTAGEAGGGTAGGAAGGGAAGGNTPSGGGAASGGGRTRATLTAESLGSFAPIAAAALALLVPDPQPVQALPERPAAVRPAAPPGTQPTPVPRDSASPQCLSRYEIGLPVHGGEDVAGRQILICRDGYVLSFNVDTRDPDWVMERISAAQLTGTARRRNNFRQDLLAGGTDATDADYLHSNFDRGHQAPAGDGKFDQRVMDESFFFTNMAPQVGAGFNRGAWKHLEERVRGWVLCGGRRELYVITGPIYGENPATIGTRRVYVPREFYKIVYDPDSGQGVGFVMPNRRIGSRVDLQLYTRSIADIETATGLDFFSRFGERRQQLLESSPGTVWGHTSACPGDGGD